jgi:NAD(P)-dependent dehydrogenase (short-subunit alcohol dehydrogenase family)
VSDLYSGIQGLGTVQECFALNGRVGLISGGAGKMSQEFIMTLKSAGATVAIADLPASLERVSPIFAADASRRPDCAIPADVSQEHDVIAVFDRIRKEYGRLDFYIHNVMAKPAGYYKEPFSYSRKTWDEVIAGNLTSGFMCSREAARLMMENETRGSIVITSSIYGISAPDQRIYAGCNPANNQYDASSSLNAPASYSASKAGLVGLAKYFATLLGDKGIRVNTFVPGGVFDGQEEAFHNEYVRRVPLGRMGVFSDYCGPILFLVSDASRYMTGSTLVVDGGWTAW